MDETVDTKSNLSPRDPELQSPETPKSDKGTPDSWRQSGKWTPDLKSSLREIVGGKHGGGASHKQQW